MKSRGALVFAKKVKDLGGYRKTADALGCSIVSIHFWLTGKRRPSADNLRLIRERLSIPIQDWFEPAEAAA